MPRCARGASVSGVGDLRGDRVAYALRRLAEDLVTERRKVLRLERENRELRTQLELLRRSLEAQSPHRANAEARFTATQAAWSRPVRPSCV